MSRFFAVVKGKEHEGVNLPQRSTQFSAGYDFEALEDVVVPSMWLSYTELIGRVEHQSQIIQEAEFIKTLTSPEYFHMKKTNLMTGFKPTLIPTGIKANMEEDEVLYLYNRSSNPKVGLVLANSVGVIDKDYFENPDNDGHIMFAFFNFGKEDCIIKKGQKIGQGIFSKYLITEDDNATGLRNGGFGSTDK